jgi:Leucine-rich repeat (LRR) protein
MLIKQAVPKVIISLTLTLLLGYNAIGNNKFKRKIDIGQKTEINLVNCNIVVPETASKVAAFAAKELQTYLSKSLGKKTAIVKSPVNGKSSIIIGNNTTHANMELI